MLSLSGRGAHQCVQCVVPYNPMHPSTPPLPHTQCCCISHRFVYRNFSDRFLDPNQIQYTYVVTGVPADGGQGPLLVGPKNITGQANARISVDGLDLVPGQRYAVTVSATNQAGQVGNATGVVLVCGWSGVW